MSGITIAIDGHSSTGKSTLAKVLAHKFGYIHIDSGAMFRGVTYYALQHGIIHANTKTFSKANLITALPNIHITFQYNTDNRQNNVMLNGESIEYAIRSLEVSQWVSEIAKIAEVRQKLLELQRHIAKDQNIIIDGRDIGTRVFPDASLKLFITASLSVRAQRRYKELIAKGEQVNYQEVLKNIEDRDYADSHRAISPLRKAKDAILIDNTSLSVDDQIQIISDKLSEK